MKTTLQIVSDTVFKEFTNANYNLQSGYSKPMQAFKEAHPLEYSNIMRCWRKRAILYDCFKALESTKQDVYWGALTFDNEHDKTSIENKRKQAIRHLNKCFVAWVMVEEFGDNNGRYHIHFISVFRYDKTIVSDFATWHSRQEIEKVLKYKSRKVVRYLTNYLEKQAPRLRKSKTMIEMLKKYKKARKLSNLAFYGVSTELLQDIQYLSEELPF